MLERQWFPLFPTHRLPRSSPLNSALRDPRDCREYYLRTTVPVPRPSRPEVQVLPGPLVPLQSHPSRIWRYCLPQRDDPGSWWLPRNPYLPTSTLCSSLSISPYSGRASSLGKPFHDGDSSTPRSEGSFLCLRWHGSRHFPRRT